MYEVFLYRLNYEEYKNNELEMDEKIKKLSIEGEGEEIEPLDEAVILKKANYFNRTEDFSFNFMRFLCRGKLGKNQFNVAKTL